MRPGMRLGEALATCPGLALAEQDPAAVEEEWEQLLRRLEESGVGVEPVEPGCVYFETAGIERLAGGLDAALRRALEAVGPGWDARVGAATRRFAALAAASVAPAGRALVVDDGETALFLEPLPLDLLPLPPDRRRELRSSGSGSSASSPAYPARRSPIVWARTEQTPGVSHGETTEAASNREFLLVEIAESLRFPEAIGNALALEQALGVLLDRLLARPERGGRAPRQLAVSARLVGGGSWRHAVTLRQPTADPERLRAALAPKLVELPAPASELRLELGALVDSVGVQEELVRPRGTGFERCSRMACDRPARLRGSTLSVPSWRSRRGRAYRRPGRCSCRATTERAAPGLGSRLRRTYPRRLRVSR